MKVEKEQFDKLIELMQDNLKGNTKNVFKQYDLAHEIFVERSMVYTDILFNLLRISEVDNIYKIFEQLGFEFAQPKQRKRKVEKVKLF